MSHSHQQHLGAPGHPPPSSYAPYPQQPQHQQQHQPMAASYGYAPSTQAEVYHSPELDPLPSIRSLSYVPPIQQRAVSASVGQHQHQVAAAQGGMEMGMGMGGMAQGFYASVVPMGPQYLHHSDVMMRYPVLPPDHRFRGPKKCDETHPTCNNCRKSKRECLGYDPIFKQQGQQRQQPPAEPSRQQQQQQQQHQQQQQQSPRLSQMISQPPQSQSQSQVQVQVQVQQTQPQATPQPPAQHHQHHQSPLQQGPPHHQGSLQQDPHHQAPLQPLQQDAHHQVLQQDTHHLSYSNPLQFPPQPQQAHHPQQPQTGNPADLLRRAPVPSSAASSTLPPISPSLGPPAHLEHPSSSNPSHDPSAYTAPSSSGMQGYAQPALGGIDSAGRQVLGSGVDLSLTGSRHSLGPGFDPALTSRQSLGSGVDPTLMTRTPRGEPGGDVGGYGVEAVARHASRVLSGEIHEQRGGHIGGVPT
ncbi:uncharacterized protein DNG_06779 [Cephalotrichum gorgonifer]|uniref:Zn(2)-C6 fungal-type domain-containing protein n=1 Tax=Cephalotrichum gorgonifer TaxID=2041049 RepID=A0AAE8SWS4_9PEZI|nr:uncharacterized protein DNG_06779 [Cephalotrichum gorgonifer]